MEEDIEQYKQGWQRAVADYQNLEREMRENKKIWHDTAVMRTMLEILPVYDNMKKALAHAPTEASSQNWVEGCKMIVRQFEDVLKRMGVEEIKALGEKFDPSLHDAMSEEESEAPEHTITKVLEPGYKMGAMVIRPAKVVLAKSAGGQADSGGSAQDSAEAQ